MSIGSVKEHPYKSYIYYNIARPMFKFILSQKSDREFFKANDSIGVINYD